MKKNIECTTLKTVAQEDIFNIFNQCKLNQQYPCPAGQSCAFIHNYIIYIATCTAILHVMRRGGMCMLQRRNTSVYATGEDYIILILYTN